MNNSIITGRYAKALLQVGIEQNCLEALKDDMDLLSATIKENPMFRQALDSPVIKPMQKHGVMDALLKERVNPNTLSFLHVLIGNKRETMLYDVTRRFIGLYEAHKGIKHACVTSASALSLEVTAALQQRLNELCQADVKLSTEIDDALIGGFILRVDDRQYDASLSSGLQRIKKELVN